MRKSGGDLVVVEEALPRPIDAKLRAAAEREQRYCAIFVGWVIGQKRFMVATTRSARERPNGLEEYNCEEVDYDLIWAPSKEIADRIIDMIKPQIKPYLKHGRWYDGLPPEFMVQAIHTVADRSGVQLFNTEERNRRINLACSMAGEGAEQPALSRPEAAPPPLVTKSAKILRFVGPRA